MGRGVNQVLLVLFGRQHSFVALVVRLALITDCWPGGTYYQFQVQLLSLPFHPAVAGFVNFFDLSVTRL